MRAARWHGRRDVRIDNIPEPRIESDEEVLIEVACCGLCGTDVHEYADGPVLLPATSPNPLSGVSVPVVLGHEVAGTVIAAGKDVTRVKVGDRVAVCPVISCNSCTWCKLGYRGLCANGATLGLSWHSGGLSRVVRAYEYMCYRLPRTVDDEMGAIVGNIGEALHAIGRANMTSGDVCAIVGGGAVGLSLLQVARAKGAGSVIVIEPNRLRRDLAIGLGAKGVIDPQANEPLELAETMTLGLGFDVVFEAAGIGSTGLLATRLAKTRGRVVIMGIFPEPAPMDYLRLVEGERTVVGSATSYGDFAEAISLLEQEQVDVKRIITDRITLDEVPAKLESLSEHQTEDIKVLVRP